MAYEFPAIVDGGDPRLLHNLVLRDAGLRLTWIPKNMCSTLKLSFIVRGLVLPESRIPELLAEPHRIHDWTVSLEPYNIYDLDWLTSVAVMRHPAARLRSALIEKALVAPNDFDWVIKPVMEYSAGASGRPVEAQTVADLLETIRRLPDRMLDIHLKSQTSFLSGRYTHLLRMEGRPQDFFESRGIRVVTVDHHATSNLQGEPRIVRADEPVVGLRQEIAGQRLAIRFDAEIEGLLADVATHRYAADLAVWNEAIH